MQTNNEVAQAVADWAVATCPGLEQGYPRIPSQKGNLPDVVANLLNRRSIIGPDERFPYSQLEQAELVVWEFDLSFMVDGSQGDDESQQDQLHDWADTLAEAITTDATLGERLPPLGASPLHAFDFDLPFVEYHDGTRGRQFSMDVAVAELTTNVEGW